MFPFLGRTNLYVAGEFFRSGPNHRDDQHAVLEQGIVDFNAVSQKEVPLKLQGGDAAICVRDRTVLVERGDAVVGERGRIDAQGMFEIPGGREIDLRATAVDLDGIAAHQPIRRRHVQIVQPIVAKRRQQVQRGGSGDPVRAGATRTGQARS